jgi:HNH endonuclease
VSTSHVPAELRRQVRTRAGECCEYCRIPESASFATHQVDHVIAEKHGGETVADNLAMSCALCNSRKGSDLASIDADTGLLIPLFHPRNDRWAEHFRFVSGGMVQALTPIGRVTARLLQFNHPDRVAERSLLIAANALTPAAD